MENLILLKEYAKEHGREYDTVLQKAQRGTFATARKIGRQWFINKNEPYSDARVTSGKYIGKSRTRKRPEDGR